MTKWCAVKDLGLVDYKVWLNVIGLSLLFAYISFDALQKWFLLAS